MNYSKASLFFVFLLCWVKISAQNFTQQDTLRGSITPERIWWDLNYYHLSVEVSPEDKYIKGSNLIRYKVLEEESILQIDLQPPLEITGIIQDKESLTYERNGNVYFVQLKKPQKIGSYNEIQVFYEGHPKEAENAPWDGGFSWKKDSNGAPFVATSCQGLGASVWWPNKDHMYDEVDSMAISVKVPKELMNVSNGRLREVEQHENHTTYHWFVTNPINNYGVNLNIANYSEFKETYEGENGTLTLDYFVLEENVEKAKEQFKQVPMMLDAFEHWFGPYPFYQDGFKLVEVPYLGMEHQSSVTYGNKYQNGYLGTDLSRTGWGLKFDFIIIHESGHEWFANNITYKDIADMWIHEGFTAYSENLYLDYHYGKDAASAYVIGTRDLIQNDRPIIGTYNVNFAGSNDMYYKGANILHTLRQLVEDDVLWRKILRGLNEEFYHQTVTTEQIESYLSQHTEKDLSAFFEQYLRTTKIPILEYSIEKDTLRYRYTNIVEDFDMPIRVFIDKKEEWIFPNSQWKTKTIDALSEKTLLLDKNFYIESESVEK